MLCKRFRKCKRCSTCLGTQIIPTPFTGGEKMKKALSIFMMVVLVLGVLSACGPKREDTSDTNDTGKKEETAKPEKLVVWEDKDKSGWLRKGSSRF